MSQLDTKAAEMRGYLSKANSGWQQAVLRGGLVVELERWDDRWRLSLGRERVAPSDTDFEACREAFGAPAEAEPSRRRAKTWSATTGRTVVWEIVELRWREALAVPEVGA